MMNWEQLLSSDRFDLVAKKKLDDRSDSSRSEFERDYDRIIFSAPFRNLQDKTQVFPLPENDFVHTRLTHSLEVSSVGRSLGKSAGEFLLRKYPELRKKGITNGDIGAIVAAAALTHDIGNPPFGHAGEEAISDFFKFHSHGKLWKRHLQEEEWADMVNFEGNAQGFRMLVEKDNGLQISHATLASFTKYPRPSYLNGKNSKRKSHKKYGFFADQLGHYKKLSNVLGIQAAGENCWLRHPLAFLVEAADDICYSIIDLEDGCTLGLVQLEETIDLLSQILGDRFKEEKLNAIPSRAKKLAVLRAMAINQLIRESVAAFEEQEACMLSGDFDQALTEIIPSALVLKKISNLSVKKIYQSRPVLEKEAAGYQVLEGLLEVFSKALYCKYYSPNSFSGKDKSILRLLPEEFQIDKEAFIPYTLLRNLIDFISGMTDKYALSLYRKVKGISLPGT
ncbi:dNTP triphosphohydrolase [Echinicola jeungdonensis]|uniref:dGTP triphosphohydrolase n=1 Tax=Echinicola jeungdonensis TaxID=709343 RepID=A0ABV5J1W0_9BACT|nr:dNTP triphosphohydrolase [Echinicola jeungdonensis]MDN3668938.1 dNTP triphosphohydrolase [Echinicola jeungdonensis]